MQAQETGLCARELPGQGGRKGHSRYFSKVQDGSWDSPQDILKKSVEHQMKEFRDPNTKEMVDANRRVGSTGLKHIRLGNPGVFVRNGEDRACLRSTVAMNAI